MDEVQLTQELVRINSENPPDNDSAYSTNEYEDFRFEKNEVYFQKFN